MSVELPRDAEGREIPLDTMVLYDDDGEQLDVSRYQYYPAVGPGHWNIRSIRNKFYRTDEVHLTQPDSWEKLLEDLGRGANAADYENCVYFGVVRCDCTLCPALSEDHCDRAVMRDIASRIRKLRGEG